VAYSVAQAWWLIMLHGPFDDLDRNRAASGRQEANASDGGLPSGGEASGSA
jgi:hypothetical protein